MHMFGSLSMLCNYLWTPAKLPPSRIECNTVVSKDDTGTPAHELHVGPCCHRGNSASQNLIWDGYSDPYMHPKHSPSTTVYMSLNVHILRDTCTGKMQTAAEFAARAIDERWRALFWALSSPPCPILILKENFIHENCQNSKLEQLSEEINLLHGTAIFPPEESHIISVWRRCLLL